jgi:hypothetical protein
MCGALEGLVDWAFLARSAEKSGEFFVEDDTRDGASQRSGIICAMLPVFCETVYVLMAGGANKRDIRGRERRIQS